jgi:hypothetical protein
MTSVQGTGQTGVRTSAFKKGVLGNEKSATKFARPGMSEVSLLVKRRRRTRGRSLPVLYGLGIVCDS